MTVRAVEWKKLWTWGQAIDVDRQNKIISLRLRDENNLIIYDNGDHEIYVDLQLSWDIEPTDTLPVGITTGRVSVANWWSVTGTLICAKTTSWDNIKVLYGDDNKLYVDNGTGTFKQVYLKPEVDALLSSLRDYVDEELAKKQNSFYTVWNTAPSDPSVWDMWFDNTIPSLQIYDGTQWIEIQLNYNPPV